MLALMKPYKQETRSLCVVEDSTRLCAVEGYNGADPPSASLVVSTGKALNPSMFGEGNIFDNNIKDIFDDCSNGDDSDFDPSKILLKQASKSSSFCSQRSIQRGMSSSSSQRSIQRGISTSSVLSWKRMYNESPSPPTPMSNSMNASQDEGTEKMVLMWQALPVKALKNLQKHDV